ncbi:GIY-YIG nuclease family protein [uncultured Planktosalinus sp.]|uniref:GIY-YIG nuclease family protein n=1 Tax=uncultured Planktosalinus sp. TaxID=1810935 RepID=UPI0030DBE935|tara:strand:- start:268 stop:522 length:255 start_codon:yes stop_codon:yes gene_type:complete
MAFYFYILYSKNLNRFYIGHTGDTLDNRLKKHLSNHKGFTSNAKDWEIVYSEFYETKNEAYQRELKVKKMKSKKFIKNLINSSK